jgi:hypothetical protein
MLSLGVISLSVFLVVFSLFAVYVPPVKAQETTIFRDDFESYAVGTFPDPPWNLWFNGAGDAYQSIVNTVYRSPSKSLQLVGAPQLGRCCCNNI